MNAKLIVGFVLVFGFVASIGAQSAKYNAAGDLTYIGDLLADATGCEPSRVFSGKISKVEEFAGDSSDGWEFVLAIAKGRPMRLQASLSHDDGAVLADFDDLIQVGRRLKVSARQCGSGGHWTAVQIWRL